MTLTPEQFNKLATKDDLKDVVRIEEMTEFTNKILGAVDKVSKKLDDIEHAFVSNQAAHDRFERRLERLEKQLNLEPMFDR